MRLWIFMYLFILDILQKKYIYNCFHIKINGEGSILWIALLYLYSFLLLCETTFKLMNDPYIVYIDEWIDDVYHQPLAAFALLVTVVCPMPLPFIWELCSSTAVVVEEMRKELMFCTKPSRVFSSKYGDVRWLAGPAVGPFLLFSKSFRSNIELWLSPDDTFATDDADVGGGSKSYFIEESNSVRFMCILLLEKRLESKKKVKYINKTNILIYIITIINWSIQEFIWVGRNPVL